MSEPPEMPLKVDVAMRSDIGRKRNRNQDVIGHLIPPDLEVLDRLGQIFVLADGVGSMPGGDLASQYAVSTILSSYYEQESGDPPDRLARAIAQANSLIYAEGEAQDPPTVMATMVVAAVVRGRDLIIGAVGDSPAYLMRDAYARKLTLDHEAEVLKREAGAPPPAEDAEGRRMVRALGTLPSVPVDIISGRVRDGDRVVLCSDGLMRYVSPQEIEQTIATRSVERGAEALVSLARERGGLEDVSVIVLHFSEAEDMVRLPRIPDPLEAWGRSRRGARARSPETQTEPAALSLATRLGALWRLVRGNTVLTAISMSVLLAVFVLIMLAIINLGGDDGDRTGHPAATPLPARDQTATVEAVARVTAQAIARETEEAMLAATAAEAARLTLTPPTPVPTSGPQMAAGVWFKVLAGDPIAAYEEPRLDAARATELEADSNYRVMQAAPEVSNGPWYQVVDNLGRETRWVNGPSLHARIVAVDTDGNPLPADQQPEDVPPPDSPRRTGTPTRTPTAPPPAGPTQSGTPGAPDTPTTPGTPATAEPSTPTATTRPSIPYGVESWQPGVRVTLKDDLNLCRIPDVTACDAGQATRGETGTIVSGPVPAGEHYWWEVEFQDGRAGWVAQVLIEAS